MSITVRNYTSDSAGVGCTDCGCGGSCNQHGQGLKGLGDFSYFDPNYPSTMPNDPVVTQNGSPVDTFSYLWDSLDPSLLKNTLSNVNGWSMFDNAGGWNPFNQTVMANAGNPNMGAMNNNAGGAGLWQTLLAGSASTLNSIARSRYGVPPPGTFISSGPNGTVVQTLPVGATSGFNSSMLGSSGFGGISLTTILLVGGGLFLLMRK